MNFITRIWVCPYRNCDYTGGTRWLLKSHLTHYHRVETEEGKDLFFHRNDLQGVDYESLTEGQEVEFEVTRTAKGLNAANVRLAGESS
jgi:CspA family cold shock protein